MNKHPIIFSSLSAGCPGISKIYPFLIPLSHSLRVWWMRSIFSYFCSMFTRQGRYFEGDQASIFLGFFSLRFFSCTQSDMGQT